MKQIKNYWKNYCRTKAETETINTRSQDLEQEMNI